ncbi:MAG: alpha/beta fold hydrolase [Granulosicoccus sp.]
MKVALPDGGYLCAQFNAGPKNASVIVLSNSVLTNMSIWEQQVSVLTQAYSVLRYDQRGHGQSSIPLVPMTFDDFGSDVLALLDAFDVQSCIFVGLSMGVPTGLAALARVPERFVAFIAVDGVARSAAGREAFWSERRDTARKHGVAQLADDTAKRWLPGESDTAEVVLALTQIISATPVEGFAIATHALQRYDYSSVLVKLAVPFLAIAGKEDGAMPDAMRQQFSDVKGAQFGTIEQAGHVPNFQNADAFNKAVLNFLTSIDKLNSVNKVEQL